jgi:D-alanyl-D-alanine carboxypeptidase
MKAANMIIGRKETLKREVASLTKIMTFFTVYEIMERAHMDLD